jgi:hypothetical protein
MTTREMVRTLDDVAWACRSTPMGLKLYDELQEAIKELRKREKEEAATLENDNSPGMTT